jgi:Domain of unknown function (DUF4082)
MNTNLLHTLIAGFLFCTTSVTAQAAPIYDFDSAPIRFGEANVTVGFQFTANANLTINALGFYDHNQDGLTTSHDVGIFDTNGTLLNSTSVSSGTAGALDGKFRYAAVPSFTLTSGQSYIIAGLANGQDGYTYGNVGTTILGLTTNPTISISPLASLFLYAPSFSFPTDNYGYDLYPMVNFKFEEPSISSVPLPAAFPLLGIGLAGLGGMQRWFSKRRSII